MGRTPIDSLQMHMQVNDSISTFRIEDPSASYSESVSGVQLPLELIAEILVRLPVKSLLKCKCVEKSWLCLISSKEFIRSHFSLSSSIEGQYSNHQLLIMPPKSGLKGCFLNSALLEPSTHVFDVEYPSLTPYPYESLKLIGIVNGLVCLAIEKWDFFIWNPALRKSKHLPSPNVRGPFFGSCSYYGFGYDESNDDYKFVFISLIEYETVVQVYSLMSDSWKRIEDFTGGIPLDDIGTYFGGNDVGTYFGGKIHWFAYGSSGLKIVTLDMVSEKYGELQRPFYGDPYFWRCVVSGGRFFVVCSYELTKKMDLWVMNKYGDEESWSKVVSIPYVDVLEAEVQYIVCILRNGEYVLGIGSCLFVYHTKRKDFRMIELYGCVSEFDAFVYVESLVWPNEPRL